MSHLVIVEDDEGLLENLTLFFREDVEELGFRVSPFSSGRQLLAAPPDPSWNLVISDVRLTEGLNGLETMRALLQTLPKIPFLIMTGYADTEIPGEVARLGALDYIYKPFDLEELLGSVQRAFRRKTTLERAAEGLRRLASLWTRRPASPSAPVHLQATREARQRTWQRFYVLIRSRSMLKSTDLYLWDKLEPLEQAYLQAQTRAQVSDRPAVYQQISDEIDQLGKDYYMKAYEKNRGGRLSMDSYKQLHAKVELGHVDEGLFSMACSLRLAHCNGQLNLEDEEQWKRCWS